MLSAFREIDIRTKIQIFMESLDLPKRAPLSPFKADTSRGIWVRLAKTYHNIYGCVRFWDSVGLQSRPRREVARFDFVSKVYASCLLRVIDVYFVLGVLYICRWSLVIGSVVVKHAWTLSCRSQIRTIVLCFIPLRWRIGFPSRTGTFHLDASHATGHGGIVSNK